MLFALFSAHNNFLVISPYINSLGNLFLLIFINLPNKGNFSTIAVGVAS